jgi:hypothetical protein
MELQHHKFGYSGNGMNFAVFSDDPCHIKYVDSIAIPIGHTQVQLYGIEPGARTKWIVVKQLEGRKATLKVFLRKNEAFLESEIDSLPRKTRSQITQRFPNLTAQQKSPLPGKLCGKRGGGVEKSVSKSRETINWM